MHEKYINIALQEAKKASIAGEIPVGAVIVKDNKIIAKAHNMVESKKNAIYHAEILAILKATKKINNWRLNDCVMYVTLEPCLMCRYAIALSRISEVYFILNKDKEIVVKTNYNNLNLKSAESLELIQNFFDKRR